MASTRTRLWNLYSAISSDMYPDELGRIQGPQERGALDAWRSQHCKAVAARPEEPQVHDPVYNQMEKPDRITLEDGIVRGFVKSSFEILKQTVLKS